MLQISERLKTVASMVPPCHTAADIGTDHGYVPAYLLLTEQCKYVIASDIAEGPCEAARETRDKYGLQQVMDVRTAPGLQGLAANEAEAVVIAGMGGATIAAILDESPDICKTVNAFILQPMNAAGLLRQWLCDHGYRIAEESLCKENGHIYVIIKALHAVEKQTLSLPERELGPCLINEKPALWPEYYREKVTRYRFLLQQMRRSPAAMESEKYKTLKELLGQLENPELDAGDS